MDLIRSRYIIHGDVQRVGYRDVVQKLAIKNGIKGEVRNLEDLDVQIIAEGTKEAISHFSNIIYIQDFPINVESIETREEPYTGEFRTFKIIRGDTGEEMAERMDTAIQHLNLIGKYSKTAADNSTTLIEMMHTSLDKQDRMLEKQDQMLQKQDQMLEKQDQMIGKQDDMISVQHETVDEIKGLRKDSKSYLEKEFSEIHKRLHSIENALNDAGIKIH
ncbi:Acylphosphatases-like protein [Methanospirillum hungatei JF-1]|uniref:acylphosphatase n=1 Tax=Methanospirillum hungatei JF-1 (strain ATCC 27890 / DSM 864 / NBRC 100397 / JF-1) TaxID=323259 RepID=Q2FNE9_METHJ|nr:acylphosphatase [Methanospirillum hungatei]ABD42846.1 Acylphosphatases-like protein [Methanospirillum hungatei JF-1]